MVDCRLPDGSGSTSSSGRWRSIARAFPFSKFQAAVLDMAGMNANGLDDPALGKLLEIAGRSGFNVLVSGGNRLRKTDAVNAMSQFIDQGTHRHHRGCGRVAASTAARDQPGDPPPSIEGTGQVTQRDLVWNALRMRPDRIVVGEVRGAEALTCCKR